MPANCIYTEIPAVGATQPNGWIYASTIPVTLSPGAWHMITSTVTTGQYDLYVDGSLVDSVALNSSQTPQFMEPGTTLSVGGGPFGAYVTASLDEFNLFSYVLSAAQIQQLYQDQVIGGGRGALPSQTPLQIAAGATFDLDGLNQTVESLADSAGSGGTVTTSLPGTATLTLAPSGSTTFSGTIRDGAGPLSLTINGPGTQVLAGSNTYSGSTTITAGTLQLGDGVNKNGSVAGNITDNGMLIFANPNPQRYSGVISGSGSVTIAAPANGPLMLAGSNTYSGGTTLYSGQFWMGSAAALGTGPLTICGGTIGNSSGAAITLSTNNAQLWNGDFAFVGYNDLNLGAGTVTLGGSRTLTLYSNNLTVGGPIGDNGNGYGLTVAGGGALTLAGSNTYSGATIVNNATLNLANQDALQNSTFCGGYGALTFDPSVSGHAFTFGGLSDGAYGGDNLNLQDNAGNPVALSVGNNNQSTTFSGQVNGPWGSTFEKIGSGVLTLGGQISVGTVIITGGTLDIGNNPWGLQQSTVNMNGGVLGFGTLGGQSAYLGGLTGAGSLTLADDNSQPVTLAVGCNGQSTSYSGAISGSGSLVVCGGNLTLTSANAVSSPTAVNGGVLNLANPSALQNSTFCGGNGSLTFDPSVSSHAFTIGGLSDGDFGAGNLWLQDNAGNPVALSVGNNNQSTTFSGQVNGPWGSSFEKIGSGVLTLGGQISVGTVLVSSGTLALAAPGVLQAYNGAIVNGGVLQLNDPQAAQNGLVTVNIDNGLAFGPGVTAPSLGGLAGAGAVNLATTDSPPQPVVLSVGGNSQSTTYSGTISGSGSLIVCGGNLTLTSANAVSCPTAVSGGVLNLANPNALQNGTFCGGNGTLSFDPSVSGHAFTIGGLSDGNYGSANLWLQDNAGNPVALSVGANNQSTTYSGDVGGPQGSSLEKIGSGVLTLGGQINVGTVIITGGTLDIGNNPGGLQQSTVNMNGGVLGFGTLGGQSAYLGGLTGTGNLTLADDNGQPVTLSVGCNGQSTTYSGAISGSGSLTVCNNVTLSGASTYSGGTTLSWGSQLNIGNAAALGTGPLTVVGGGTIGNSSGAAITLAGNNVQFWNGDFTFAGPNDLNLGAGSVTLGWSTNVTVLSNTLTVGGPIGDNGNGYNLTMAGSGTLALAGSNTYGGGTTLYSGQLNINHPAALGTGPLTICGGTIGNSSGAAITLSNNNAQLWNGDFTFAGPNDLNLGAGSVTFGSGCTNVTILSNTLTVGGPIGDNGNGCSLTMAGSGTLALAGSNSYGGGTTLYSGQLNINNASALGTGPLTISGGTIGNSSGAAVVLSNNNTQLWNGDFTFAGPNDLNLGAGAVTLGGNRALTVASNTLTVGGPIGDNGNGYSLTLAGAGTLVLAGSNTYTGGTTISSGLLLLTGSLSASTSLTAGGGTFTYAPTAGSGAGNSQAVAGLTVNAGGSGVNVSAGNTLALGAIVRNTGGVVNFNSNTMGTITTIQPNTNGILSPWATYGSGTSMSYAAASGSGAPYTIIAYTGATPITSGVSGLTDTTGTVNYTLSGGGGMLAAAVAANTIQFTGVANTIIASAANPLSLNGIMNDGSGTATISGGNLVIGSSQELVFTGPGNMTVASVIQDNPSGPSALTMGGGGTLVLTAANTYSGPTTISGGTLQLNSAQAAQNTTVIVGVSNGLAFGPGVTAPLLGSLAGSGAVNLATTDWPPQPILLTVGGNNASTTYSGTLSGSGSLVVCGGNLTLTGANTFGGATAVSGGVLNLANPSALQNSTFCGGNGTLTFDPSVSGHAFTIGGLSDGNYGGGNLWLQDNAGNPVALSVGANNQSTTYSGQVGGPWGSSFTKIGSGILTLNGSINVGTVIISGGTLDMGSNPWGLQQSIVSMNGGVLGFGTLGGQSAYLGGLTGTGNLTLSDDNAQPVTLTVGCNSAITTYSGAISGSGSLVVCGGNLTLTSENAVSCPTAVSGGVLNLANPGALQNSTFCGGNGTLSFDASVSSHAFTIGGLSDGNCGGTYISLQDTAGNPVALSIGNNNQSTTFSGYIYGPQGSSLAKIGSGILTLGGQISVGTVIISSGTLDMGNNPWGLQQSTVNMNGGVLAFGTLGGQSAYVGGLTGTGNLTLADDNAQPVTLSVGWNGEATTYSGTISGSGSLLVCGGNLTLTSANAVSCPTTVSGGTLNLANPNALQNSTLCGGGSPSFDASVSGHAFTIGGLSDGNGGYLWLQDNAGNPVALSVGANNQSTTYSGQISGPGGASFTKIGSGTLTLDNYQQIGVNTIISGGALDLTNPNALQQSIVNINGGVLGFGTLGGQFVYLGGLTGTGNLTLADDNAQPVTLSVGCNGQATTYSGTLRGSGSLTVCGGNLTLANANTFSGATAVSSGTLNLANPGAIQNSTFSGGGGTLTFDPSVSGHAFTFGGLSGYNLSLQDSAGNPVALSVGNNSQSTTYYGSLNGSGSLTKVGSGTLTLAGTNTYTGGTSVNAGILATRNTAALPGYNTTGMVSVAGGATLAVFVGGGEWNSGNTDNIAALVAHATFNPGSALGIDTAGATGGFTCSSSIGGTLGLTKLGPNTLILSGSNTYTGGTTVSDGTLELASPAALPSEGIINVGRSGTVDLTGLLAIPGVAPDDNQVSMDTAAEPSSTPAGVDLVGQTPANASDGYPVPETGVMAEGVALAPVPEPSTLVLLGVGALAFLGFARRKKTKR